MTWKDGDLICDWCDKVIKVIFNKEDVTEHDIKFYTGWTRKFFIGEITFEEYLSEMKVIFSNWGLIKKAENNIIYFI